MYELVCDTFILFLLLKQIYAYSFRNLSNPWNVLLSSDSILFSERSLKKGREREKELS